LVVNGAGPFTAAGDLDIDNNFILTSGIFNAGSNTLTIGGDFTNAGTFNANTSTVVFDTAAKASTIYGTTTFNDFKSTTAGKALNFEAGKTQIVIGTVTLVGSSGNVLTLRSTVDGTQWLIDPQGARNISYVDVKDSNNINTMINPPNSIDSGNNINWFFPPETTIDHAVIDNNPVIILMQIFVPFAEAGIGDNININDWQNGFNGGFNSLSWQEGDWPYSKNLYNPGKYRTIAVLVEGNIVFGPYDDRGLLADQAIMIHPGQRRIMEGEVGEKMIYLGFDFARAEETEKDDFSAGVYLPGTYRTTVKSYEGVFQVIPYDARKIYYKKADIIKSGEVSIQIRDIK
jgi:hypothetical protein